MTRSEAIDLLAKQEMARMGEQAREALLLDWWSIDADDAEFEILPESLKAELSEASEPEDLSSSRYEPLLLIALRRSFVGVVNCFLEKRLAQLGYRERVEGAVESLECCPCCAYRSLRERGAYEICRVCFWEDDGTREPDSISVANRMSLGEARQNFLRLGAVTEGAQQHVLPDGKERYSSGKRS